MKYNLQALQDAVRKEQAEDNSSNSNIRSKYPLFYPGVDGKITVRLLYCPKMQAIQRRIVRHDSGKGKVACLAPYGEDCPICKSCNDIEDSLGKESGVWRKYGFKTRGICYAQIVDYDSVYFTEDNSPTKGDVILLMYPKSVYDQINDIIVDSGANLEKIVTLNEGIPIIITRKTKRGAFPEYKVELFPYGACKSFEDDTTPDKDGNMLTGQDKFEMMLDNLDNLGDEIMPSQISDDMRDSARALSETIRAEYNTHNIVNPTSAQEQTVQKQPSSVPPVATPSVNTHNTNYETVADNSEEPVATNTTSGSNDGDKPSCFGAYCEGEHKCMVCPHEVECLVAD